MPNCVATASTIERDERSMASAILEALSARPLLLPFLLVACIGAIRAFGTVDSDVSWQLWIAHQLNGGARLYSDIIETNPPLWFWMGMPVDRLAQIIHIRSDHVLIAIIGVLALLSLGATNHLVRSIDAPRRAALLSYAALVLVAIPWLQFGQREQIALIGTLPYAALVGARRTGRDVHPSLAFVVGALAAAGFALKHYFLIVPILLELWLIAGEPKKWRPLRPETAAVVLVGALYAIAFVLLASSYFSVALPLILLAYGVTGAERFVDLLQPAVLVALATLVLIAVHPRILRSDRSGFGEALVVAAAGFAGAYFIQAKGWTYHAVPLAACASLAFVSFLGAGDKPPRFATLAAPALLFLPFWIAAQQAVHEPQTEMDVRQAVEGLGAGDSVGFIGSDPALGWNVTLQRHFNYPSRYNGFWMMRAVVRNEASRNPDPRFSSLGKLVVRQTVVDFQCLPPRRIIIARPTGAARAGEFDILAFFLRDPRFSRLLAHYRPVERSSVEVFERISPLAPGRDCLRRAGD
jgi:hypothetical protein